MAWTNSLTPILMGAVVYALEDLLTGIRSLLIIALVPMAVGAALVTLGLSLMADRTQVRSKIGDRK